MSAGRPRLARTCTSRAALFAPAAPRPPPVTEVTPPFRALRTTVFPHKLELLHKHGNVEGRCAVSRPAPGLWGRAPE